MYYITDTIFSKVGTLFSGQYFDIKSASNQPSNCLPQGRKYCFRAFKHFNSVNIVHCVAYLWDGRMREGGVPVFDSYDMNTLWFKFGHDILKVASKCHHFTKIVLAFHCLKKLF